MGRGVQVREVGVTAVTSQTALQRVTVVAVVVATPAEKPEPVMVRDWPPPTPKGEAGEMAEMVGTTVKVEAAADVDVVLARPTEARATRTR